MSLEALAELNRALQENRVDEVTRVLGREPGMRALACEPGVCRWEWQPSDQRARNPFGFLYGGYLAVFVDVLLSSAIGTVLSAGELATTAEFKIEFLRPTPFAPLRGEGRVLHKGSRVAFVDARVLSTKDELFATASSTWTVMRPNAA
jgi:uncharacterized protein (TIGR00369 family)